jgi:hypothetical protein
MVGAPLFDEEIAKTEKDIARLEKVIGKFSEAIRDAVLAVMVILEKFMRN